MSDLVHYHRTNRAHRILSIEVTHDGTVIFCRPARGFRDCRHRPTGASMIRLLAAINKLLEHSGVELEEFEGKLVL